MSAPEQPEDANDTEGLSVIPGSQRPDGTWRKARRVKDGYVPQEEVPLYESKGKSWSKGQPDHPIGLAPDDVTRHRDLKDKLTNDGGIPGLPQNTNQGKSKSQKKKQKKQASAARKKVNETMEITCDFEEMSIIKSSVSEDTATTADPAKKLRNLQKKLVEIEKLEKQIKVGEVSKPDQFQLDKVKKKRQVLDDIRLLKEEVETG